MITKKIKLTDAILPMVLGRHDRNIKNISSAFDVQISALGNDISISGEQQNVYNASDVLTFLNVTALQRELTNDDLQAAIKMAENGDIASIEEISNERVKVAGSIKYVTPKTITQKNYIKAVKEKDMVFGYGPAGTGKTFLAVAMAVHFYLEKKVDRIVLTRPAVEAGEKLGFLPGDLAEKINPYLRPLYDALYAMLDYELVSKLIEKGAIEVAPLAFMRGRTLTNAFVILDEAQNTTISQMKMFLTRLGFGSKAIITGDITQIDLPNESNSGLNHAIHVLNNVDEIAFIHLTERDVVRHPLVTKIIKAYDRIENAEKNRE